MRTIKRILWLVIPAALFALTGCNVVIPFTPVLSVKQSGLGEYEARPTWQWGSTGIDLGMGYRYSLDDSGQWTEVGKDVQSFQPDRPLGTGTHTLHLQLLSASGIWSQAVSKDVYVKRLSVTAPSDPLYLDQWDLGDIMVPELWAYFSAINSQQGLTRHQVVVAVLDTGYTDHPDLIDNVLTTDGYDFVGGDSDATDPGGSAYWHGTGVASILAADVNNGEGIAGIGDGYIKIMPVRVLDGNGNAVGSGDSNTVANGILYAAGIKTFSGVPGAPIPAKIINMSLGVLFDQQDQVDPYMEQAIQEAVAKGVIIVCAAGNERQSDNAQWVDYPASSPDTIAVGATTFDHSIAYYSNPGTALDVVAPGGGAGWPTTAPESYLDWITVASLATGSTYPYSASDYGYYESAGTSEATPHVAGVLALLCSVDSSMTLSNALTVIASSSVDLGPPGKDVNFGYGLINALQAYGQYALIKNSKLLSIGGNRAPAPTQVQVPDMSKPGLAPQGSADSQSLIVRFTSDSAAASASSLPGVRSVSGTSGTDRVVHLAAGQSLEQARDKLLASPGVSKVYFNYIYHAL